MGSVAVIMGAVSGQATLATLQQSTGRTNYARQLPSQVKVFQPSRNALVVGRASTSSEFPHPARLKLDSESHGLASVSNSRSFASSAQVQESLNSSPPEENKKTGLGVLAIRAGIITTMFNCIVKFFSGGVKFGSFVKRAEADIDTAAEFVEEGATLVAKVAEEVEQVVQTVELSAKDAEELAQKVEVRTEEVKKKIDEIANVLDGDKKLSTTLTDYAAQKKQEETS